MKLALRKSPDSDKWNHKAAADIIRTRLVTRYPHAGIAIGSTMYHATAANGVHSEPFAHTDNWVLFDYGDDDEAAIARFKEREGRGYDWISLLSFAGVKASDSRRDYCYELVYYMKTGKLANGRVTPETLLELR
jgi:hypothetical protein